MSRLDAVLGLMTRDEVDVLFLGREANARTVADTSRLWLSGTRPFSPSCVVVRASGAVHVLANSDDAVPAGFPVERLYGITWNPEHLLQTLLAIPGVAGARRIGVDGMTPQMHALLASAFTDAEFVDGGALFAELQRTPDQEALAGVEAAATIAIGGLTAMAAALQPGLRPRTLRGLCASAFAGRGVPTPAFEAVAAPLDAGASTWMSPERALVEGENVVLRAGVLCGGWEASLARSFTVGSRSPQLPDPAGWDALVAACMPGVEVGALRKRDAVVYGTGRGVEPWDDDVELAEGLMVAIESTDETSLRQDILRITDDEPVIVTRFG